MKRDVHEWNGVNEPYGSGALNLSREEFAARFEGPFFCVLVEAGTSEDTPEFSTLDGGAIPVGRGVLRVFPLAKQEKNPFSMMITFGRAPNNDLHIELNQVSKFHGYFSRLGPAWQLTDAGSTNGTVVHGKRLEHRRPTTLTPGTTLTLGEVPAWFVDGVGLFDLLTGSPTPA